MPAAPKPLLADADIELFRTALAEYTVAGVHGLLGLAGRSAHGRGDLAGVARAIAAVRASGDRRLATLIELFLLGRDVDEQAARAALHPLPLDAAQAAGLLASCAGSVRALVDVRPYAEAGPPGPLEPVALDTGSTAASGWWVVSDLGSDVRPGPLSPDHVLGIGAASLTLAQATPRLAVRRALDIGTGCGVQALHLGRHAGAVVATDVSMRALRFAATTAALSEQHVELRAGSLCEPVEGERFDLVVANPPFVVSAGGDGYDYRDSGLVGDEVCSTLLRQVSDVLAPGGSAVLLANWIIPQHEPWQDRVGRWLDGSGCDAWVWQREVAEPGEYVALWLRDGGLTMASPDWTGRYDAWLDWFARAGVAAVGMGMVVLWRSNAAAQVCVLEEVPQAIEQPIGAHLPGWIARQRWLHDTSDTALLAASLHPAAGLVRSRSDLLSDIGWQTVTASLRQSFGMRWEVEVDDAIAALVAGCAGGRPLLVPVTVLAASLGSPVAQLAAAALPVVRDLVGRGFLLPAGLTPDGLSPDPIAGSGP